MPRKAKTTYSRPEVGHMTVEQHVQLGRELKALNTRLCQIISGRRSSTRVAKSLRKIIDDIPALRLALESELAEKLIKNRQDAWPGDKAAPIYWPQADYSLTAVLTSNGDRYSDDLAVKQILEGPNTEAPEAS
jgi:hypothetical protein